MIRVCVTVDTEGDSADNPNSTSLGIEVIVPLLVSLFSKYKIKSTFFVQEDETCRIGTAFSNLWKSLEKHGHEIGHHAHGLIKASAEKQDAIITQGIQNLRKLGINPVSFRAGRYHLDGSLIRILEKNNIKYDSSVIPGLREHFPDGTQRCDHIGAPYNPYFLSYEDHRKEGNSKILEFPINRYPKVPAYKGLVLARGLKNEEVLFDYFYEIRKDKLIIVIVHTWDGLSSIIKKLVRKEKYGKVKRFCFESMRKIVNSNVYINSSYLKQFDAFFQYVLAKKDVFFSTIKEAGESIYQSKFG